VPLPLGAGGRDRALDARNACQGVRYVAGVGTRVERRPHPTDRRANALHMTSAGERRLREGRRLAREAQEELLGALNDDERRQLHELLFKLAEAADPSDAAAAPVTDQPPARRASG
jgi:hypothetical protein